MDKFLTVKDGNTTRVAVVMGKTKPKDRVKVKVNDQWVDGLIMREGLNPEKGVKGYDILVIEGDDNGRVMTVAYECEDLFMKRMG